MEGSQYIRKQIDLLLNLSTEQETSVSLETNAKTLQVKMAGKALM